MARHDFELKSDEQILLMRRAGLITAAALAAVKDAIRPGVSTLELDQIASATIESMGAKSNFQLVPGYHHTICASINDEIVHGIPSAERILQPGDIISIDAGAIIDGWNGDSAITVVVPAETLSSPLIANDLAALPRARFGAESRRWPPARTSTMWELRSKSTSILRASLEFSRSTLATVSAEACMRTRRFSTTRFAGRPQRLCRGSWLQLNRWLPPEVSGPRF